MMIDQQITDKIWDVVVIGTGIGGGISGRRLAEAGRSVLFIEKGPNGPRTERTPLNSEMFDPVARQVRGFWPDTVHVTINDRPSEFFAPLGSGVGGSSIFYAATLERPEPHDLDHSEDRPHPTGGWPVGYDAFVPYFDQAEKLFHICGTIDPLSDERGGELLAPPVATAVETNLLKWFAEIGLNPYRAHMAAKFLPGCENCFGRKCPKTCKMDGRSAGVEPAVATGNAIVLDKTEVVSLGGDPKTIFNVVVKRDGQTYLIRGRQFVLAAGALASPNVLQSSVGSMHPNGYGNNTDMVGRNLMFHLNEMAALWPKDNSVDGTSKAIAMRDFYFVKGQRFGVFQSMGLEAGYGEIVHHLNGVFDRSILRKFKTLRQFTRIPAAIGAHIFGKAKIFVGIFEDLPYLHNRIRYDASAPNKIQIEYKFTDELLQRRKDFRTALRKAFGFRRMVFLGVQPELNFGHPSGTLRFGDDPKISVLSADCRVHGVSNLYVADASFMPTSMGVNPSLMIAANALRVADIILDQPTEPNESSYD